ncbi:MAG TPA: M23 family metallopeptidase, partial [Rhizomicrobium sp.]
ASLRAPSRKGRGVVVAAFCLSSALAGCETAPPREASYWPEPTYLTVIVHRGDTVSQIAARYNITAPTLVHMNGLSDGNAIRPGEVLRVPAGQRKVREAVYREADAPRYESWNTPGSMPLPRKAVVIVRNEPPIAARSRERAPTPSPRPVPRAPVIVASNQSGNQGNSQGGSWWNSFIAPTPVTPAQFLWPVEGKVIVPFGQDEDGARNEGINIAAAVGAPIRAAASGTVTYAGNELKGYGNLVLIKHDNGYVTAYAHAQSISVNRGDRVEKGQVIGLAGQTGDVATPQLHFEIRRGVEPVDPKPLLLASRES